LHDTRRTIVYIIQPTHQVSWIIDHQQIAQGITVLRLQMRMVPKRPCLIKGDEPVLE
jgi:hypothetical protein